MKIRHRCRFRRGASAKSRPVHSEVMPVYASPFYTSWWLGGELILMQTFP